MEFTILCVCYMYVLYHESDNSKAPMFFPPSTSLFTFSPRIGECQEFNMLILTQRRNQGQKGRGSQSQKPQQSQRPPRKQLMISKQKSVLTLRYLRSNIGILSLKFSADCFHQIVLGTSLKKELGQITTMALELPQKHGLRTTLEAYQKRIGEFLDESLGSTWPKYL